MQRLLAEAFGTFALVFAGTGDGLTIGAVVGLDALFAGRSPAPRSRTRDEAPRDLSRVVEIEAARRGFTSGSAHFDPALQVLELAPAGLDDGRSRVHHSPAFGQPQEA